MSKSRDRKDRLPPFVPLLVDTLDSPAWQALSHGAARLYISLRRRYSFSQRNNGRIFLSTRQARRELHSNLTEIGRWFRELQHYGFIIQVAAGCLGSDGYGKAPHWRLTELGTHAEPMPSRDFLRWDGAKFKPRKIQNPDPEKRIRVIRKSGSPVIRKSGSPKAESDPEIGIIQPPPGDPEIGIISRITTPCASEGWRPRPEKVESLMAGMLERKARGNGNPG